MKKISLLLMVLFILLAGSGSALAVVTLNTGTIIGTYYNSNDWEKTVEGMLTGVDLTLLVKEVYEDKNINSGSSTLSGLVYYYTVKAGNDFVLYEIDGGATTVYWANETITNGHDELKDVSHITFWATNSKSAVPIPASVFLFGSGLIGVVGLSRNRKKIQ